MNEVNFEHLRAMELMKKSQEVESNELSEEAVSQSSNEMADDDDFDLTEEEELELRQSVKRILLNFLQSTPNKINIFSGKDKVNKNRPFQFLISPREMKLAIKDKQKSLQFEYNFNNNMYKENKEQVTMNKPFLEYLASTLDVIGRRECTHEKKPFSN